MTGLEFHPEALTLAGALYRLAALAVVAVLMFPQARPWTWARR